MKKTWIAWILACCMLLPACDFGGTASTDGSSPSESSFSESSESDESGSDDVSGDDDSTGTGGGSGDEGGDPPATGTGCAVEHVDGNNDGECDECEENVLRTFDFYALNDVHGKFATNANYEGIDKMSTYLRQEKLRNPNTVLLASGDMLQGAYESNLTQGAVLTEWMNELDFAAMTLGNHEYDWGEEAIEANAALAEYPLLAINVYDKATGRLAEYCQPSVMVEQNGAKIGIIGAEGNVTGDIAPEKIADLEFKVGAELTDLVKAEATSLRQAGADCIVYSLHDGPNDEYDYYDFELSSYVDIVFEAHTHQTYVTKDSYGVYHLQSGGDNRVGLSHAEMQINIANEKTSATKAETVYHSKYAALSDDPVIDTIAEKYAAQIAPGLVELGDNGSERDSDAILGLASQAYYEAGAKKWADKDIVLGGGYIGVRFPYKLAAGKIIYGDLLNVLPFDNEVVLCSVNGTDLKAQFIDRTNYNNYYSAYGNSVKDSPVATETYYIVIDSYCASSSANYAPSLQVVETYAPKVYARDLLAELIKDGILAVQDVSIPEAQALGNALSANQETTGKYRVTGRIKEVESSATPEGVLYGNMTIEDSAGNTLYIYGTVDAEGKLYGAMANPPQVGDIVTLEAPICKYVNKDGTVTKIEMKNATIVSFQTPISIARALEMGNALSGGASTPQGYYVCGEITQILNADGNMYITDGTNTIYVYKPEGYSSISPAPKVGDKIIFYGKIQHYSYASKQDQKIQLNKPTIL